MFASLSVHEFVSLFVLGSDSCSSLHSLFSMESASMFNSEEEELCSWHYSKHMVEQERQEHIQRLREQGIAVPEDELTNSEDQQGRCTNVDVVDGRG